ncbi:MAG: hypothetical protein GXP42_07585 [Chloroflexi bacterium]|nr:hypothetical protein [Chloroflexota bacterium]
MATVQATRALHTLQSLYAGGLDDTFIDRALQKVVERQIERDETDLARLDTELRAFEHRFGLTSDEFWRRYQAGEMEDNADFMEWNVFYKMRRRIQQRLRILRGENGS